MLMCLCHFVGLCVCMFVCGCYMCSIVRIGLSFVYSFVRPQVFLDFSVGSFACFSSQCSAISDNDHNQNQGHFMAIENIVFLRNQTEKKVGMGNETEST